MVSWAIALHGGAGMIAKENMTSDWQKRTEAALSDILNIGVVALKNNLTAVETVELVVRALESDALFNAGKGSVLTNKGTVEMEACIMDGRTKDCGAVSGLSTVVHPVSLARLVMENSPHVYLGFDGAEEFARIQGVETVDSSFFITEENLEKLEKAKETNSVELDFSEHAHAPPKEDHFSLDSQCDCNGNGEEKAYGNGNCNRNGNGVEKAYKNENCNSNGNGNGVEKAYGNGDCNANANRVEKAYGNGNCNSNGNGVKKAYGNGDCNGNGNVGLVYTNGNCNGNANGYTHQNGNGNGYVHHKHPQMFKAEFETVGCAVVDSFGNCAAATSTGGLVNKMSGRIGDTPIIGAGTYANYLCGVSGTGRGEEFIKHTVAREVAAMMEYKDLPLAKAVHKVIHERLPQGMGGLVAVSASGEVAMAFNTPSMFRASAQEGGKRQIGIWEEFM